MTDLAQQLSSLAVRQHAEQGRRCGKASLLFTNQEAADIDNETIYNIALEGLDQLCALDGRFDAYRRTLFGQASQVLDRDGATSEVNAKLDTAVAGFCTLLSSYFLLGPAFKALEFLVRKYRVHELNVEELMLAALPYHETEQFVRLVQILRLEPRSCWAFLEPMQQSGAPVPRESLVLRCITDRSLLRFVCETAQRQADPRVAGRVTLSFYAVLVCEYVAKQKAVDEALLTMLLPFVLAGLTDDVVPDYRSATYMIIGQLSVRATFSQDLVLVLVTEICRYASPTLLSSAVILLAHLANTQEHLTSLPERAIKHLAKAAGVVDELAALSEKGCRIERLLVLLVRAAVQLLPTQPHYEQLLQTMLTNVQMGNAARTLADAVLQQARQFQGTQGAPEQQQEQRGVLLRLLRTLDLRYPAALDAALDAVLLVKAAAGDEVNAPAGSDGQQHVLALLSEAFEGTARSQLLEAGTTVLLAAEAPAASMRQLAVMRLDAMLASSAAAGTRSSEASAAAGAALLRRLDDESNAVVQAALSCDSLIQLPPIAVFEGLASCFHRAIQQAADRNLRKAQRAEARGVARKALKLVTGPLLAASPALLPRILPLMLAALLASQACGRKLAATAAKVASKLGDPLLAGLEGLRLQDAAEDTAAAAPKAQPTKRKSSSKKGAAAAAAEEAKAAQRAAAASAAAAEQSKMAADAAYNGRVVAALASHAAANSAAGGSLAHLLLTCHSQAGGCEALAEPLLLMTAHAAVQQGGQGAAAVAAALVQQLQEQAMPDASSSGDGVEEVPAEAIADVLPRECFEEDGVPTSALLLQFARGQLNGASMRSTAVLAALQCAPWSELAPHGSKDLLGLVRNLCALHWRPALAVLAGRMAREGQDAAELLSVLFAAPADIETLGVRVAALQLTASLLEQGHAGAGRGKKASSAQQPGTLALLARLMCVLCHPDSGVRHAAVGCVRMLVLADRAGKALASALSDQAAMLEADAEAPRHILAVLLAVDGEPSSAMVHHSLPPAEAASLRGALLEMAVAQAVAAGSYHDGSMAVTAAHTAHSLLEWLADCTPAQDLLLACHKMIAAAQALPARPADSPAAQERELLLTAASACFTAQRMEALVQQGSAEHTAAVLTTWCELLQPGSTIGTVGGRLAALKGLQGRTFAVLPPDVQGCCLEVLLQNASKDPDHACRCAARDALASLPLAASALVPLLSLDSRRKEGATSDATMADASPVEADDPDEQLQELQAAAAAAAAAAKRANQRVGQRKSSGSAQKRSQAALEEAAQEAALAVERRRALLAAQRQVRRQGRVAAEGGQQPLAGSAGGNAAVQGIEGCGNALELLLWKDSMQEEHVVVPAVQAVLKQLLAECVGSNAVAAEQVDDEAEDGERAAAPRSMLPPAEAMYLVQLCLSVLLSIAQRQQQHGLPAAAFDLGLAVSAAQQAPSGAVRNAALELIAALAVSMPQAAVDHVLDVVAVVGDSATLQDDEQSERVAAQALSAILPAWIAAGNSLQQLAGTVVAALPRVSSHRRLPLLSALVSALPQVEGLCNVLALLLQQAVPTADVDMAEAGAEATAVPDDAEHSWTADLAADLMEQAPLLLQASVAAALLEHSLQASKQQAWQPLPLLSVAFVTQLLEQRRHAATVSSAEELTDAYQRLMQQALLQLQALGERQAAVHAQAARSPARASAASPALLRAGTAGCYRLLHALQQHMPPATFLAALVSLAGSSPADRVRRKALQLFATAVDEASAAARPGQESSDAAAALAEAAVSVCEPAVHMLQAPAGRGATGGEPVRYLTKQTALAALGTVAGAFGAQHPARLLAALPAVLVAAKDEHAAVRGSALAATASMAAAMGPQLVPQLPQTIAAVIEAVQAAAATVADAAAKAKTSSGADTAPAADASGSDSDGQPQSPAAKEPAAAAARASGVNAAAALELAAALAAVAALVEHLGAFLAPHLTMLLSVLLHPAVLQCKAARCSDVAAAIRRQLAQAIPTRLLLAPLMANLEVAAEAGADSACGLLHMLGSAVDAMDVAALASHHEAVFAALLRALDMRRRRPAALLATSDGLDRVERAAVDCFVALTMRLTDARFKPLFFRLLEWAHAVPAGDTAGLPTRTAQLLRSVALFSLVNALAERLRGVFVPYFSLLLDACVAHLTSGSTAEGKRSKKKKRKSVATADASVDADAAEDPLYVEHDWRLRLKVVRTLHRCFLYDTGAAGSARFLDDARFQRLLPPLVAHLDLQPPAGIAAVLKADGDADGAADLEASLQLGNDGDAAALEQGSCQLDPFGRAVVACLAQLAVTAGSDAQWKPLNHQVLMMTRSLEPRTRLLALDTVQQLVARLSEEYLVLLPETLPFLAELLEDAELAVESAAAALVRRLEELSGESLEQYLR